MNTSARFAVVGIAAAAAATLAACSTGTAPTAASTTPTTATPTTSQSSTTGTFVGMMPGGTSSAGARNTDHNDADVTFAQQMIVHHRGAIAMADLAPTRADNQQVKDLAATIKAAQAPEIEQMTGWLQAWAPETDMNGKPMTTTAGQMSSTLMTGSAGTGGMDHGMGSSADTPESANSSAGTQMPGMMTPDQMTQLTAATGVDFDKLFLQLMITHHQGAVQMADTELAQGSNPDAQTLAQSIKTSQTQEIATMQQLLTTL